MKKTYGVGGMTCSACSLGIEKCVGKIEGVESVAVSLLDKSMTVTFSGGDEKEKEIFAAVRALGYSVYPYGEAKNGSSEAAALKRRFFFSLKRTCFISNSILKPVQKKKIKLYFAGNLCYNLFR